MLRFWKMLGIPNQDKFFTMWNAVQHRKAHWNNILIRLTFVIRSLLSEVNHLYKDILQVLLFCIWDFRIRKLHRKIKGRINNKYPICIFMYIKNIKNCQNAYAHQKKNLMITSLTAYRHYYSFNFIYYNTVWKYASMT